MRPGQFWLGHARHLNPPGIFNHEGEYRPDSLQLGNTCQ